MTLGFVASPLLLPQTHSQCPRTKLRLTGSCCLQVKCLPVWPRDPEVKGQLALSSHERLFKWGSGEWSGGVEV